MSEMSVYYVMLNKYKSLLDPTFRCSDARQNAIEIVDIQTRVESLETRAAEVSELAYTWG